MKTLNSIAFCSALAMASVGCPASEAVDLGGPLVIGSQGSFFVGGVDRHVGALIDSSNPSRLTTREGTTTIGQMYVQYQIPNRKTHLPVVLIHGGGMSGQGYESTPDGRMGWSEYFLRSGRPVYSVDQSGRGRSGFDPTAINEVRLAIRKPESMTPIKLMDHQTAWTWFRIGPTFGAPFQGTQFPVEAVDEFNKMWIPDLIAALPSPNPSYRNLAALGRRVGGAVLLGHSQSFMFPMQAALVDPVAVRGIVSLETGFACNVTFSTSELAVLARIPMLIVFADHLDDASETVRSTWTKSLAQCRVFADGVRKAGGNVTFIHLPEVGIFGNTHMMMIDRNNLQIARLLTDWMEAHVEGSPKQDAQASGEEVRR